MLEHVRAMNDAATRLSLIATGQVESVEGVVRIAASEAVAAFLLPPIVKELRARHPGIELELVVSNATSDLRRREADIAIRHVRPQGDDMVARLVREKNVGYLYGAPSYLKRLGNPQTPEALAARADVIGFDETDVLRNGLRAIGLPFGDERFPVRTENHLVQWELAKRGVGLCMMMDVVGERERRVRRALPGETCMFPFSTWLISHRELWTSRRMRVVFALLADLLIQQLEPPGPRA